MWQNKPRLSVAELEGGDVFGPSPTSVVMTGGRDVGVTESFRNLSDARLVAESVGSDRRPQSMDAQSRGRSWRLGADRPKDPSCASRRTACILC